MQKPLGWVGRRFDFHFDAMTNRATEEADYNTVDAGQLATDFRTARLELVGRLEALPPSAFMRTALHPRLGTPMRLADMLSFQAEHDDHHFAMMRWIEGRIRG